MPGGIIEAYNDGYIAREDGLPINSNPFQTDSKEYKSWRTGWFNADHDILYTNKRGQDEEL